MLSVPSMDLSNLYRHSVFRSRSPGEAQKELDNAITRHQLRWSKGEVASALYRRDLRHISLMALRYGAEVEVRPDPFESFALVQMPLRGSVEIECDGISMTVESGEVAVLNPRKDVRLLWQPQCEQLILKIPLSLMQDEACNQCSTKSSKCGSSSTPCGLDSAFKLAPHLYAPWRILVQQLVTLLPDQSQPSVHQAWIEQMEKTVAQFLVRHQPSALNIPVAVSSKTTDSNKALLPLQDKLQQLEAYIKARLFAPISLADLARAAGVSPRTLHLLCHRHRGVAPMELLRNLRLDAARQRLLSERSSSVTDVALEFGFGHLGRFSAYYRSRFGELPRQTLLERV